MHKYDYTVLPDNSPHVFKWVCQKIEEEFPKLEKMSLLIDVDGSTYQRYGTNEIIVFDDYEVGAVYVESNYPLVFLTNITGDENHE